MEKIKTIISKKKVQVCLIGLALLLFVFVSNFFLQLCQNSFSLELATNFAFFWHTEKFLLGCLVLLVLLVFLISLLGSLKNGLILDAILIFFVGIADFMKMSYRQEPLYPDDLKMVFEWGTLKDIAGTALFSLLVIGLLFCAALTIRSIFKSLRLPKKTQIGRLAVLVATSLLLLYLNTFNNPNNFLRKAYNQTALWIPYSQKMNYYNTGFIGGFLYNLDVEPMEQPKEYSQKKINEITEKYQSDQKAMTEKPNIIYVMNESFSDPARLKGITIENGDPLAEYRKIAEQTFSGQMLSQNYGGGTANIEFEALTSFSMEPLAPQLTTPYTQLVPKLEKIPSVVSYLNAQNYQTTAIHPHNTSMYKRKDVYQKMGFDQFLAEDQMKHTQKIDDNPFISDEAAYEEVLDLLNKKNPQFVHLVTMQLHMPYENKYHEQTYQIAGGEDAALEGYLQDLAYSSQATASFLEKIDQLDKRTLVVFWGDHLPGIYSENLQSENKKADLHQTEFLIYDNQHQLKTNTKNIISPTYFAEEVLSLAGEPKSGFYHLTEKLKEILPAFEKGMYYHEGQWQKELQLTAKQQSVYEEYCMIQYDILAGKQYSMKGNFYSNE